MDSLWKQSLILPQALNLPKDSVSRRILRRRLSPTVPTMRLAVWRPVSLIAELIMLTAEGCRQRRQRLWKRLSTKPDVPCLLLNDPIPLSYFANFWVDPFSLGSGFGGYLLVGPD